jgi:hypothetical protein
MDTKSTVVLKLSKNQIAAVEVYVTDPAHEEHAGVFSLENGSLHVFGDLSVAWDLLLDASNIEDDHGNCSDKDAEKALLQLSRKISKRLKKG